MVTGYVEVNIGTPADGNALEHPMWVIMPKGGYWGYYLYNNINGVFAQYAPQLHATMMGMGEGAGAVNSAVQAL